MSEPRLHAVLCLLFFLSGTAALLFETLWFRLATLAFGNSVWASSLVLSSFMMGLALGNAWAARRPRLRSQSVSLYARLELTIGLTGLGLVLLLPHLSAVLAPAFRPVLDRPLILNALRLGGAFVLFLAPSTAMGATLPILVKAFSGSRPEFGRVLGRLYGWNTLGAVGGALAGEGLLLERLGIAGTGVAAAVLNLTAWLVASRLAPRWRQAGSEVAPVVAAASPARGGRALLAAASLAGATLLAFEVLAFRFLLLFVHGTSRAFAVMLAAVLAGIALGGLSASALLRRERGGFRAAGALAFLAGAAVVGAYAGYARIVGPRPEHASTVLDVALLALPLVFPVSFLSGLLFTAIGRALQDHLGDETRTTGVLTLANTLGAMLGSLIAGFVLLPALGLERSIVGLALAYGVVGVSSLWGAAPVRPAWRVATGLAAATLVALLVTFPFGHVAERRLDRIVRRFGGDGARVLAVRESPTETIVYLGKDLLGQPLSYRLVTNGFSMASTDWGGRRYMKAFVYLPLLLTSAPRRALLISYGVGATAQALVDTPRLESIDVVDISRDVLEASRVTAPPGESHPLDDPRVRVHVEDGRFFLLATPERFDLITAEPPPPKYAGIGNLYSREYFALVRDRLTEGGVASYWLPMFLLEPGDAKAIAQAFCAAFDDCSLWATAGLNWMLVGTRDGRSPGPDVDPREWSEGKGGEERRRLGFETPAWLVATFLGDAAYVREWAAGAAPLEDNWPYRLSPHIPPQDRPAAEYAEVMAGAGARRRFVSSAWVRQVWGQALRDQAEALFEQQQMLNGALLPVRDPWYEAFENAARAGAAAHVLGLLLGMTPDERRLAEQALARGGSGPVLEYYLGVRALSRGDAGEAVRQLGPLHARNPGVERIAQLLAIAHCHDGRPDAAADVASRFRSAGNPFWTGLASRCRASGLPRREVQP
jgi:predicted membrane-bound spermidine synthase